MKPLRYKLLPGAVLALAACAALAQNAPVPTAPLPGDKPPTAREDHEAMRQRMASRHAERLERLKKELNLSPEQEKAWAAYRAAMQPPNGAQPEPRRHEELAGLSTPERIDRMNDRMARHQEQMRQRGEATKAFYATLNAQQQKIFDRATPPHRP